MAVEGQWPKSDGDILFASEVNKMSYDFVGLTTPTIDAQTVRVTCVRDNGSFNGIWANDSNEERGIVEDGNGTGMAPNLRGTSGKMEWFIDIANNISGYEPQQDKIYTGNYRIVDTDDFQFMTRGIVGRSEYQIGAANATTVIPDYMFRVDTYFEDVAYGLTPTYGNAAILAHDASDSNAVVTVNSTAGSSSNLEIDLGQTYSSTLDTMTVFHQKSNGGLSGSGATIQCDISTNGSTWTTISAAKGPAGYGSRYTLYFSGVSRFDLSSQSVRYIRFYSNTSTTNIFLVCVWKVA